MDLKYNHLIYSFKYIYNFILKITTVTFKIKINKELVSFVPCSKGKEQGAKEKSPRANPLLLNKLNSPFPLALNYLE